jgi:hypothetical protein
MNERIRQLIKQSYVYSDVGDGIFFSKEKFAELIVKECMSVIELDVKPSFTRQDVYRIRAVVKQHFGVEE